MSDSATDVLTVTTPSAASPRVCVRQFESRRDDSRLLTALLGAAGDLVLVKLGFTRRRPGPATRRDPQLARLFQVLAAEPQAGEDSRDHEMTLDEAREAITLGAISRHDLIDVGRGWETIVDCLELEEALLMRDQRADYLQGIRYTLWCVVCSAISLLVYWWATL